MSGHEPTSNLHATISVQNQLLINTENSSRANQEAQGTDLHSEEDFKRVESIIEENQSMIDHISNYQKQRDQ